MRHAYATVDCVRVAAIGLGQHHGACAAVAAGASFFGVGGTQLFAQNLEQGASRWYIVQRDTLLTVNEFKGGECHANEVR
jgi:hypothetical protein